MGYEPDPETFLPDDLGDLLFDAPRETLPAVKREVLALGVNRVEVADERFQSAWAAMRAQAHPTVAEARGLRALARELDEARAAAPGDVGMWERGELVNGLVGALPSQRPTRPPTRSTVPSTTTTPSSP